MEMSLLNNRKVQKEVGVRDCVLGSRDVKRGCWPPQLTTHVHALQPPVKWIIFQCNHLLQYFITLIWSLDFLLQKPYFMASATKDTTLIPTAVDGCGRSFLSLAESLRSPSRFADQVASEAILDEFDRFKLWLGNH